MSILIHSTGFYKYPKPWENRKPIIAIKKHLKYIEADREDKEGNKVHLEPPTLFTKEKEKANRSDPLAFGQRIAEQPEKGVVAHKLVISLSEDEQKRLGSISMIELVRETLSQYELARKQQLDWIASFHNDKGHPHCHVVIRGRDLNGKSVYISEPQMKQMARIGERVKERLAERNLERGRYMQKDLRKQLEQEREIIDRDLYQSRQVSRGIER